LASARPDWSLVLVGPCDTNAGILSRHKNVRFVGKVPYADIPRYAAAFDVGLIPFVLDKMTVAVNPLKLLEYFACGIPVVSTPLPEVARFGDLVRIGRNIEEFTDGIERALRASDPALRARRINVARESSWAACAEKLSLAIEGIPRSRLTGSAQENDLSRFGKVTT
jgi:glycosyltransferase involved in cell wall biosynthesis